MPFLIADRRFPGIERRAGGRGSLWRGLSRQAALVPQLLRSCRFAGRSDRSLIQVYDYRYPLREWEWDRMACADRIRRECLPVPVKSSCLCGAMKVAEVLTLRPWCLRLIVLMEARTAPRLCTIDGRWRKSTSERPGSMTGFTRDRGLPDPTEIDQIIIETPRDLVRFQEVAACLPVEDRPAPGSCLERFHDRVSRMAV